MKTPCTSCNKTDYLSATEQPLVYRCVRCHTFTSPFKFAPNFARLCIGYEIQCFDGSIICLNPTKYFNALRNQSVPGKLLRRHYETVQL